MEPGPILAIIFGATVAFLVPFFIQQAARRSAESRFAAAQPTTTLTLLGVKDKQLDSQLVRAQRGGIRPAALGYQFLVTFSTDGVKFFTSARDPQVVSTIAADRILSVDLGSYTEQPEYQQPMLQRMRLRVTPIEGEDPQFVDIQFGFAKLGSPWWRLKFEQDDAVQTFVHRARAAVRGKEPAFASPPVASVAAAYRPGTLEPGVTAYRASRIGNVPLSRFMTWFSVALAPLVLVAAVLRSTTALLIVGGVWAVQWLAVFGLLWRASRAEKREREAGYTTLNGRYLNLEQRHPTSGMVIRDAEGPAIPDDRFRELLAR